MIFLSHRCFYFFFPFTSPLKINENIFKTMTKDSDNGWGIKKAYLCNIKSSVSGESKQGSKFSRFGFLHQDEILRAN